MRAVAVLEPGRVEIVDVSEPKPGQSGMDRVQGTMVQNARFRYRGRRCRGGCHREQYAVRLAHGQAVDSPAIQNLRHVVGGWIPFTILDCGGSSIKWCNDLISGVRGEQMLFEELITTAAELPEGIEGLYFYPYMLGERRRENTSAQGGFFGLTLKHSAGHMVRAVMEGVALAMGRDVRLLRGLGIEVDRIRCVAGGTRNALWNQIKADVVQMPLETSDEPDAEWKGAALLGAAGVGLIDDLVNMSRHRQPSSVVPPRTDRAAWSRTSLDEFSRINEHMLGFWQESRNELT